MVTFSAMTISQVIEMMILISAATLTPSGQSGSTAPTRVADRGGPDRVLEVVGGDLEAADQEAEDQHRRTTHSTK